MPERRLPLIISHRGCSQTLPENTIGAFEAALYLGADGIELDVWECLSGDLVVHHDEWVKGVGSVRVAPLEALRQASDGSIETLQSVLSRLRPTVVNIEIKGSRRRSNEDITRLIEQVILIAQIHCVRHTLVFSSFDKRVALHFHRIRCYGSTSLIVGWRQGIARSAKFSVEHQIGSICLSITRARPRTLRKITDRGISYSLWKANDRKSLVKAISTDASSIITDDVALARELMD